MESYIENQALIASLFENATEGIIVTNKSGEIVLVNPCAEKMFGYEPEELKDQKVEILLPETNKESHIKHRKAFHKSPVNKRMGEGRDLNGRRKDGTVFPVEVSLSHYFFESQPYVIAFIIDVSVRKNNEKMQELQREVLARVSNEVKKLNADLENKITDRTIMLRETLVQLEDSKVELEKALEREKELGDLKSRFVSTVSHEFRTPLAAILTSASLLERYTTSEEQPKRERHVERIRENVRHLTMMLEDLLSLGKLEEGLIQAKPESFDLSLFMSDFVNEMKVLAKEGQILQLSMQGEDLIKSDKRLLRNILINLVSNAIKFSPEHSKVEVICNNEKSRLVISVSDSGIGISEEDRLHLFERFFRGRNAQNIQGTGLGLHIVSKYVELLKGSIDLQSELQKGTTFVITVPLA